MLTDAAIMAHSQCSRVDKTDASATPIAAAQVRTQADQDTGHELNEAIVADLFGKLTTQMVCYIFRVVRFEISIPFLMKMHHDSHHFAHTHHPLSHPLRASCEQGLVPLRFKLLPKHIYVPSSIWQYNSSKLMGGLALLFGLVTLKLIASGKAVPTLSKTQVGITYCAQCERLAKKPPCVRAWVAGRVITAQSVAIVTRMG